MKKAYSNLSFVLVIALCLLYGNAFGTDFRYSTTISSGQYYDTVSVYDFIPQIPTTIEFYGGAGHLYTYGSSTTNIRSGGGIGGMDSELMISEINDSSTVNLYPDGSFSGPPVVLQVRNSGTLNIRGGFVSAALVAYDNGIINLYDGQISGFYLAGTSTMNIYDGCTMVQWANSSLESTATLNIYGSDFSYDPHGSYDDWSGIWFSKLTGLSYYGNPVTYWGIPDPATNPNIHLIPEPATLLLLGLGGMMIRAKRAKRKA